MGAERLIPWEEMAIDAETCAALFGRMKPETFLRTIACRPDFPERVSRSPATWVCREVLAYRDANRVQIRRRRARHLPRSG
jgi:hypothetical protein